MILWCAHTTSVCVFKLKSRGLQTARWHFQFWFSLPHWLCDLCTRYQGVWKASHLQYLYPSSNVYCYGPCFTCMQYMDMSRKHIRLILELMAMFLLFQMTFSLVTATVVWAILKSTSGLDPSFDTIAPRYLKLWTVSSFLLSTEMSVLMPLVLFVINCVVSALICTPYAMEASSRWFTNLTSSCSMARVSLALVLTYTLTHILTLCNLSILVFQWIL